LVHVGPDHRLLDWFRIRASAELDPDHGSQVALRLEHGWVGQEERLPAGILGIHVQLPAPLALQEIRAASTELRFQ